MQWGPSLRDTPAPGIKPEGGSGALSGAMTSAQRCVTPEVDCVVHLYRSKTKSATLLRSKTAATTLSPACSRHPGRYLAATLLNRLAKLMEEVHCSRSIGTFRGLPYSWIVGGDTRMRSLPRREFIVQSGATLAALAALQSRVAQAFPSQAGEKAVPWLDQPPANPDPKGLKDLLVWEDLDFSDNAERKILRCHAFSSGQALISTRGN